MFLSALRLFRSLSGYHYRMIIITILLPVIGPPAIANFGPDLLVLQVVFYVSGFFGWTVCAVLAVASMLRTDKSGSSQIVAEKFEAFSGQILRLSEEGTESRVDDRQQLRNLLQEFVRSRFEQLGVLPPPRRIKIRPQPFASEGSTLSAKLTVVRGSKMARMTGVGRWCECLSDGSSVVGMDSGLRRNDGLGRG